MSTSNDSHLSKPSMGNEKPPIPQHKRLALGMKGVNGQSNPNGGKGSTTNMVGNSGKTF